MIIVLGALAVLCGTGLWLYTPDKSRATLDRTYLDASDTFVPAAGVRLHVRQSGPTGRPAVILLHGFGASLQTWDPWAEQLAASYHVIRLDLPGFALTGPDPTNDYSDRRSVAVVVALMDRLGVARASLIGNSLGGKIAWMFAAEHPDRTDRLVLISPDGFASPGFAYGKKPRLPLMVRLLPYTLPKFLVRASLAPAYGDPARLTDQVVTRYRDLMLAPGVRPAMLTRMAQVMLEDPAAQLGRIRAPTLLLWGERDGMIPFANAADYVRDIQDAVLVPLPGLGHVPFEEAPLPSLQPVSRFLDGGTP